MESTPIPELAVTCSRDGLVFLDTEKHGIFSVLHPRPLQAAADMIETLYPNGSVTCWDTRPIADRPAQYEPTRISDR